MYTCFENRHLLGNQYETDGSLNICIIFRQHHT